MKTRMVLAAIAAACALPLHAQPDAPPAWRSMIAAERAFAAQARREGIRPAFLQAYAHDGILFTPKITNGPRHYGAEATPGLLEWTPEAGEMSASGDFGYDYGPFAFTPPDRSEPASGGHFLTVWERDERGAWKVAVDNGVHHAVVPFPKEAAVRGGGAAVPAPALPVQRNTRLQALMQADRALARALTTQPAAAFDAVRTPDCLFLREGHLPLDGAAADAVLARLPARGLDSLEIVRMASAGDLAFTGGVAPDVGAKRLAYYLRIWRHTEAGWRLAVDMTHY
jgi:ketosteroid isomerase-like protein